MKISSGDLVFVIDRADEPKIVVEGVVQSVKNEGQWTFIRIKGQLYNSGYVFPISAKEDVMKMLSERARLKKELDDSIGLYYEIVNKCVRGEYPAVKEEVRISD